MDLEDVDGHTAGRGELLVAYMALEVLGLLMLHQDLLVVEFAIAVIAPHLGRNPLLLLTHLDSRKSLGLGGRIRQSAPSAMNGGTRRKRN